MKAQHFLAVACSVVVMCVVSGCRVRLPEERKEPAPAPQAAQAPAGPQTADTPPPMTPHTTADISQVSTATTEASATEPVVTPFAEAVDPEFAVLRATVRELLLTLEAQDEVDPQKLDQLHQEIARLRQIRTTLYESPEVP